MGLSGVPQVRFHSPTANRSAQARPSTHTEARLPDADGITSIVSTVIHGQGEALIGKVTHVPLVVSDREKAAWVRLAEVLRNG